MATELFKGVPTGWSKWLQHSVFDFGFSHSVFGLEVTTWEKTRLSEKNSRSVSM